MEAIIQRLHTVGQRPGAVGQGIGGIGQIVQRVAQIVKVGQVAGVQIIQRRGRQDRGREVQREVGHIGAYLKIGGDLGVLERFKLGQAQAVGQARHRRAQHCRLAVQLHDLAVVGFDVGELVPVQDHRRDGCERHADRVLLPVHRDGLAGVVGVVKADAHPAALPGEVVGRGLDAVQVVSHAGRDRQGGVGLALVGDGTAAVLPGQGVVGPGGVFLVALFVDDVPQRGHVRDGRPIAGFQHGFNGGLGHSAVGVGLGVNCL